MSLRFFRRIRIAPGVTLNLSKRGASVSVGPRGMKYTVGTTGTRATAGLPGTGLRYTQHQGWGGGGKKRGRSAKSSAHAAPPAPEVRPEEKLTLGFFARLFTPKPQQAFVNGLREIHLGHTRKGEDLLRPYGAEVPDAAFLLGFIALQRRRGAEASHWLEHARRKPARLGGMFRRYGLVMQLRLQVTEEVTVMAGPDKRGVLLGLAEAYQLEKDWDAAISSLEQLLRADPQEEVALLSYCELLLEEKGEGRPEAEKVVRRTADIPNGDDVLAAIRLYRARALRALGVTTAARDLLTQTLRKKKGRSAGIMQALRYERALVYTDLGHERRARSDFEALYAADPDYLDVRRRLGLEGGTP